MTRYRLLYCLLLSIVGLQANATDLQYRLDVSYSEANPDYSAFENGDGASIYGEILANDAIFAFIRRADVKFRPSGPVDGGSVEYWDELGAGFKHPISDSFFILGNMSLQYLKKKDKNERGHGVQVGARYQPFESFGVNLYAGRIDVVIKDWTLRAEMDYRLTQHTYLVARLRDYADWDVTYYEFGAGIVF
ncbi:hypothetical protein BTA51_02390 [Hahella sp. CCB-MM4]|uniref:hypothetical protein n=1 Tax=Hahella sp. (strain CCB-MM4) TaxID=1926491 RepID=UPI000B9B9F23|nr:hypothetical protein [Hahella sp. CCB-MM4]OZG75253.1 hypothetical protein BTA51_02390 [Hahella sp. CCB-MM4]